MQGSNIHYHPKKFINKNTYNIKNDKNYSEDKQKFRQFMETKNVSLGTLDDDDEDDTPLYNFNEIQTRERLQGESSMSISQSNYSHYGIVGNDKSMTGGQQPHFDRFVQEFTTFYNINSSNRDVTIYPKPNSYKVSLKRNFENISSVLIKDSIFPNTSSLIRDTPVSSANNLIYWQFEEDIDSSGNYITYVATIDNGNYTASGLATEIQNQMNAVRRETGNFPSFTVTIDEVTDLVTFESFNFDIVSNPFSFDASGVGETSLTVTCVVDDNGFAVGDKITVENAEIDETTGVASALFNTEHVITSVVDADTFNFVITANATLGTTGTGGNSVSIGKNLLFKLLWSEPRTCATVLGFPEVDTSFSTVIVNSTETYNYPNDERLKINKVYTTAETPSNFSIVRTTKPHLLTTGDKVYIFSPDDVLEGEDIQTWDHLYGVTTSLPDPTEEDNRKIFVAEVSDAGGYSITYLDEYNFYIPVAYIAIPTIDNTILPTVEPDDENGDLIIRENNQSITLTGDTYLYICCPQLSGNILSNDDVDDIFCKIQLSGDADAIIYNSYIGGKFFYDIPLNEMFELEFTFRDKDGNLFEFYDQDHSFTIAITESIQRLEGQGFSGRIGART